MHPLHTLLCLYSVQKKQGVHSVQCHIWCLLQCTCIQIQAVCYIYAIRLQNNLQFPHEVLPEVSRHMLVPLLGWPADNATCYKWKNIKRVIPIFHCSANLSSSKDPLNLTLHLLWYWDRIQCSRLCQVCWHACWDWREKNYMWVHCKLP